MYGAGRVTPLQFNVPLLSTDVFLGNEKGAKA